MLIITPYVLHTIKGFPANQKLNHAFVSASFTKPTGCFRTWIFLTSLQTGHCRRHFSTEAFFSHKLMFKFKTSHSCSTSQYSPHILSFDKFSPHCLYSPDLSPSSFSPTRLLYTGLLTPFVDTPCEQKNLLISVPIFQTPENHKFHSIILCLVQF